MAKPFCNGLKVFLFSVLKKERINIDALSALFFGQANLLENNIEDAYYIALQKEYAYLKHKHNLKPPVGHSFQFFGMRPKNFPRLELRN